MDQASVSFVDQIIGIAQKLGSLSSSAILALVVLALGYRDYKKDKDDKEVALERLKAWQDSTKAEIAQTEMMDKGNETIVSMSGTINMLVGQVKILTTLIDERIPRR